ncbi:MAG: alkaline phosphatase family protein, partial [Chloroflexota bacterium]
TGPNPTKPDDPIFWAFNKIAPTTNVFEGATTYLASMERGTAGFLQVPADARLAALTALADGGVDPATVPAAPADTVLRADGPIKHVFFIVRENRSYDQVLGDASIGNGDPTLSVFPQKVTPNIHSLVTRFPLLDNVLANSEASIEGHYWTAAGIVPDYVNRNWVQEYAGRMRPNDFGMYAVAWPGNGFLFDQAERQGISYFNYGEAFDGGSPSVADANRSPEALAELEKVNAKSDLGPDLTPGGCYASDATIGQTIGKLQLFDSSLPAGAAKGSISHVDCFRARFADQLAAGSVPALNYLALTSDHTRGTEPGFPVPSAMMADSDTAIGELIDTISHSAIWSSSAIFVVEDDSQDGADHVDAHRIPVMVVSPYAKTGTVISTQYDLLSFVRSVELIIGMKPLSLNDALAVPLYDAFASTPVNAAPVDGIPAGVDLLEFNTLASPWAAESAALGLGETDTVSQVMLDAIIWRSVYGEDAVPPPPGPNAESTGGADGATVPDADD